SHATTSPAAGAGAAVAFHVVTTSVCSAAGTTGTCPTACVTSVTTAVNTVSKLRTSRAIVAASNRSVAYSTRPHNPSAVSAKSTDKSNFDVACCTSTG